MVDFTEELLADNMTELRDAMLATSMDIQMTFQPRLCNCAYRDIAYYLSCTSIVDAYTRKLTSHLHGAAVDSG